MNNINMDEICELSIEVDGETVHCGQPATERIAGEQDSFGTEWIYVCAQCAPGFYDYLCDQREAEAERRRVGNCQSCRQARTDLRGTKRFNDNSWEEQIFICPPCYLRLVELEQEELDFLDEQEAAYQRRYGSVEVDLDSPIEWDDDDDPVDFNTTLDTDVKRLVSH
jgi:hypothetical protein